MPITIINFFFSTQTGIIALLQARKTRQGHQILTEQEVNVDPSSTVSCVKTFNYDYETSTERGRTRRKRRDFFGTIKKRLSRSKTRSRSAGREDDNNHEDAHSRSISADRARDPGSGKFFFYYIFENFAIGWISLDDQRFIS